MSEKRLPYDVLLVASGLDSIGLARFPYLLYSQRNIN